MKSEECSLRRTNNVAIRENLHPPQHIVEEILDRLNKSIIFLNDDDDDDGSGGDGDNGDQANSVISKIIKNKNDSGGCYWLEDVQEAKSAQQEVYILRFGCSINHKTLRRRRRHLSLSQQSQKEEDNDNNNEEEWIESMIMGQNRLILRIWKGGARWWNLNRNENPYKLFLAEIMGYQIARNSFDEHHRKTRTAALMGRNIYLNINNNSNSNKETNTYNANNYKEVIRQKNDDDNNNNNSSIDHNDCGTEHHNPNRTGMRIRNNNLVPISNSNSKKSSNLHLPKIPRVLYFRSSYTTTRPSEQQKKATLEDPSLLCWAVLEYVGPDDDGVLPLPTSMTILTKTMTTDTMIDEDNDNNDVEVDESYLNSMIKIRTEFGFDEPHPRWGRVPVDQALQYARIILQRVLLPLHCYSSRVGYGILGEGQRQRRQQQISLFHQDDRNININDDAGVAQTYSSMVCVYRQAWKEVTLNQQQNQKQNQRELKEQGHCCEGDLRIEESIKRLERGLKALEETMNSDDKTIIPQLDPVLVHLDLQPQNIIFGKNNPLFLSSPSIVKATAVDYHDSPDYSGETEEENYLNDDKPTVFSVLDWEDAAWADPRFDLILLCRKVCANRDQANALWFDYANALLRFEEERMTTDDDHNNYNSDDDNNKKNENKNDEEIYTNTTNTSMGCPTSSESSRQKNLIGPIEPWLQLETVHSITTMLLQSTDLLNFGRNPWETKKDLWGKLQREFTRLDNLLTE
jgi:thiamine kinase-like enzyme